MFIDASAMVAILFHEGTVGKVLQALDAYRSKALITNVVAVWEVTATLRARKDRPLKHVESAVARLLLDAAIETVGIAPSDLPIALSAFDRYGRHRYPEAKDRNKGLNMGDCFHYATATSLRVPMLTTDEGFALTDLDVILISVITSRLAAPPSASPHARAIPARPRRCAPR